MFTRQSPIKALRKFVKNVCDSPEASSRLMNWSLKLSDDAIKLDARILVPEKLVVGKGVTFQVDQKADWGREATTNHCLRAVSFKKWVVVCVEKNLAIVTSSVSIAVKLGPNMGMAVAQPEIIKLPNDRTETYLKAIRDSVSPSVQLVMTIMPTPRDDR